jgi:hypothetical protein
VSGFVEPGTGGTIASPTTVAAAPHGGTTNGMTGLLARFFQHLRHGAQVQI